MTRYVKIKGGLLIEVVRVSPKCVTGFRVKRNGERVVKETKTTETTFMHVFLPSEITCDMVMNLHYGELEPSNGRG